ncbi:hypothetical protein KGY73_07930 [bacterium]|nr:hypothetical protein [bacterium]
MHEPKTMKQLLLKLAQNPQVQGKVVFTEDSDINVARHMVEGMHLWRLSF